MNFSEIASIRQSCRNFDPHKKVEKEKLEAVLNTARLSPSACNSQPYHITVCTGDLAKEVGKATAGPGINQFTENVPVMLVISEEAYSKFAAMGAKLKKNDYRSIDIGILSAYITAEATAQGLATCILGWLDSDKICALCGLENPVRLVIALGYAAEGDKLRQKKRKDITELVSYR